MVETNKKEVRRMIGSLSATDGGQVVINFYNVEAVVFEIDYAIITFRSGNRISVDISKDNLDVLNKWQGIPIIV